MSPFALVYYRCLVRLPASSCLLLGNEACTNHYPDAEDRKARFTHPPTANDRFLLDLVRVNASSTQFQEKVEIFLHSGSP